MRDERTGLEGCPGVKQEAQKYFKEVEPKELAMAYETLEKDEWKEVRKKFDAIGYCCFAPADLKKKKGKK